MKKMLASILVLSLVFCCAFAVIAEEDTQNNKYEFLNNMDENELLSLKYFVERRLAELGVYADDEMFPGVYTVGKDIRPGTYEFVFYIRHGANGTPSIMIFNSEEDMNNDDSETYFTLSPYQVASTINLKDGQIVKLSSAAIFVRAPQKKSWSMD